jgi:hypothetical protein
MEVARAMAVCAAEAFAQEATATRGSTVAFFKEVEDWAALIEREAQERVLRMEAESAAVLAFAHGKAEGFARSISLLEG